MLAFVHSAQAGHLEKQERAKPTPGRGEVLLRVKTCGVCRTDLHVVDGELAPRRPAIVPGHEIVGYVEARGPDATLHEIGDRVGVPWLAWTCGECRYCLSGAENLCDRAEFTGWTRDGGYAEYALADERFCFGLPAALDDVEAAPLLCAGLIGFRAWRKAAELHPVERLGLYGFGAAAHLLAQFAIAQGQEVYAFTRPGDVAAQRLALDLGCAWVGGSGDQPPAPMDAAILFAPVGELVVAALKRIRKGGTVVCAGIHMSDIPSFPYADLWEERRIISVANLTRDDARAYFPLAAAAGVRPHVTGYRFEDADKALEDLRRGAFAGAAVLTMGS